MSKVSSGHFTLRVNLTSLVAGGVSLLATVVLEVHHIQHLKLFINDRRTLKENMELPNYSSKLNACKISNGNFSSLLTIAENLTGDIISILGKTLLETFPLLSSFGKSQHGNS